LVGEKETARVEAFSDGVFAIAITLLVLDLKVPRDLDGADAVAHALVHQWPAYLAFLTSFATIGIMWINHHRLFTHIHRVDHGLLIANVLLMLGVTLVPFPTAVLAEHSDRPFAAMLYSGTFLYVALAFNWLWRHARRGERLLRADFDDEAVRAIDRAYAGGPLLYVICFGLAVASARASELMNLALAVYFGLPHRKGSIAD
jgi:uncharacterized membrane protein